MVRVENRSQRPIRVNWYRGGERLLDQSLPIPAHCWAQVPRPARGWQFWQSRDLVASVGRIRLMEGADNVRESRHCVFPSRADVDLTGPRGTGGTLPSFVGANPRFALKPNVGSTPVVVFTDADFPALREGTPCPREALEDGGGVPLPPCRQPI